MGVQAKNWAKQKSDSIEQSLVSNFGHEGTDYDAWDGRAQSVEMDDFGERRHSKWWKPAYIPTFLLLVLIILVVILPLLDHNASSHPAVFPCENPNCDMALVESIPIGLEFSSGPQNHTSTYSAWLELINASISTIDIASFYWTLKSSDVYPDPSSANGNEIFEALKSASSDRNIKLRIAQNLPSLSEPNLDTEELQNFQLADVRSLNFTALMGAGVLHTKFWIVDKKHFYIGSANMDWRSLTQVKELGVVAFNCPCLATDLSKIFAVYWALGGKSEVPEVWPDALATRINLEDPAAVNIANSAAGAFFSSSPPPFSPEGRTGDIEAVLNTIQSAQEFIHIAVMDYYPAMIYGPQMTFWPVIDDALRRAYVDRNVNVRLLISKWTHTRSSMISFLKSLSALRDVKKKNVIEVKLFDVPTNSSFDKIPFSRVNHNKYMITDKSALIGTSNWSGDYFVNTAGVSLVINVKDIKGTLNAQLFDIFERDWESKYAWFIDNDIAQI